MKSYVYIADDEHALRGLFTTAVARRLGKYNNGYHVRDFVHGREALEAYRELNKGTETDKLSLVITDLEMPKMDGLELARSLRKAGYARPSPIILVTGNAIRANGGKGKVTGVRYGDTTHDYDYIKQAGVDEIVPKPVIDLKSFLDIVERNLGLAQPQP